MASLSNAQKWGIIVALGVVAALAVWLATGEGGLSPVGGGDTVSVDPDLPVAAETAAN